MISRMFFIILGLLFMFFTYSKVKKQLLSEKESLFWMCGSIFILILSIFPNIIVKIAKVLQIEYSPSLLFILGILFLLSLVFRLTIYVSILKDQVKELAQRNTILENNVFKIEEKMEGNIK